MDKKALLGLAPIVFLNAFLFFPYLNIASYPKFSPDKLTILFFILFIFLSLLSRLIYALLSVYLIIANTIFLHVAFHWGSGLFGSRITTAMESPSAERLEYLKTYVSAIDLLLIPYATIGLAGIWLVYRSWKPSIRPSWWHFLLPLGVMALVICTKPRAVNLPPIALPLEVYAQPMRTQRLAQRNAFITSTRVSNYDCDSNYQNIVIVIGESASADRNPLYGYVRGGISALADLDFKVFSAISPANQTRLSVPLMLTHASVNAFDDFYQEPSIVTELKACGFQTYWLSNQPASGKNDDNIASISKEADISLFLVNELASNGHHYDEDLVEKIQLLNTGEMKKAFFLHLAGSHFDYNERFPDSFSAKSGNLEQAYDQSIRYTEVVLRKIFDSFSKQATLFIYTSDHGEVFVGGENGHANTPSYQEEYRVPLLLWSSDQAKLNKLQAYVGGKTINMESFNHIVRFLVGSEQQSTLISFDRKVLEASETRIVDFDSLLRATQPSYAK